MEKFFFTFGSNHTDVEGKSLGNYFVMIEAESECEARNEMIKARGPKWAFSYPEHLFIGQEDKYGIKKVPLSAVVIPPDMQQRPFGE